VRLNEETGRAEESNQEAEGNEEGRVGRHPDRWKPSWWSATASMRSEKGSVLRADIHHQPWRIRRAVFELTDVLEGADPASGEPGELSFGEFVQGVGISLVTDFLHEPRTSALFCSTDRILSSSTTALRSRTLARRHWPSTPGSAGRQSPHTS
jgi:hypothetical protein